MKHAPLVALLSLVLVTGLITSCQPAAPKSDKVVIGLSLPTQREERWVRDKLTMETAAKDLGIDLRVTVADADMAQQASQVEQLLSQNIKVLILAPHDGSAAASLVDKAKAQNVPVISYDRLIMNSKDVALYVTFDNVKVGEIQGKFITEKVPQGNYIVLAGAPTDNNATLFKQGAMKYIQPLVDSKKIRIVTDQAVDNWLPANALSIVENSLTANKNKVDAILAPNDGTAGGAIQALSAQGLAGKIPITGQDAEVSAAKRILDGSQSMTVFKDTRELGKGAIQAALDIAKGKAVSTFANGNVNNAAGDIPALLFTATLVTKDNIDVALISSGYMTKDQVYGTK